MKTIKYVLQRLDAWAEYRSTYDHQRGYASTSTEARAMKQAEGATRTNGVARWRGQGTPPPMPKETRGKAGSRPPAAMWGYAPVDEVDRLLHDLRDENDAWCKAVTHKALSPGSTMAECAHDVGLTERSFRRQRKKGLEWLATWLK